MLERQKIRNYIFGKNILKYFLALVRFKEVIKFNFKNLVISFKWLIFKSEFTNYNYDITELNRKYRASFLSFAVAVNEKEVLKLIEELESDTEFQKYIEDQILRIKRGRELGTPFYYGRRIAWYVLIRLLKPQVVVETGTDKGLGTLLMARALQKNGKGRVLTLDIDPFSGSLIDLSKWSNIEILRGDSLTLLPSLEKIDFFIHDSNHDPEYEFDEFCAIESSLVEQSIVLSDNSHISDSLHRWSEKHGRRFIFFKEESLDHWHPGDGIGMSIPMAKD